MKLAQFDVKCAFLYRDLNEEIYMKQPQGYEDCTQKVFIDAGYAGDVSPRKSTSGMILKFSGGAITCALKRQKWISLYTTEAEVVAACRACEEAIWLYRLFMEIHHLQCVPVLQV
ncbi:hypothetical protein AVEN_137130-1 [Araneus ventricosus]|uniref:Retrovirus-related Pol polyprotein from transposon TNT 1-94 n=1 Tax=Araneus ventricosus TaxID=182803 RepID=A0A4Y2LJK5_ARAVE|nr:hypothetical protein AVEN_137130-1 [Araneus ventricosus]